MKSIRRFLCRWLCLHDTKHVQWAGKYEVVECPHCGLVSFVDHEVQVVEFRT